MEVDPRAVSRIFPPVTFEQRWIHKCARLVRLNQMFADDSLRYGADRRLCFACAGTGDLCRSTWGCCCYEDQISLSLYSPV